MTVLQNTKDPGQAPDFCAFWGKSPAVGEVWAPYHPLHYHGLDVAAVAQSLMERDVRRTEALARLVGIPVPDFVRFHTFAVFVHDIGKLAEGFQNLEPDLFHKLRGRPAQRAYTLRHDALGWLVWRDLVTPWLCERELTAGHAAAPPTALRRLSRALDQWGTAVTGHHGKPPSLGAHGATLPTLTDHFGEEEMGAARAMVDLGAEVFLGGNRPLFGDGTSLDAKNVARASWWLAGLTVVADWLGSNEAWFKAEAPNLDAPTYFQGIAVPRARLAVEEAGLVPQPLAAEAEPLDLLSDPHIKELSPLQRHCHEQPLPHGSSIFILEDSTGAGKTEAAILLIHKLLASGRAEGVYFALPTMATATTMYERFEGVYRRLFAPSAEPTLALAHGRARLVDKFTDSVVRMETRLSLAGEEDGGAECSRWIAERRKRALLAHVGIGTVDQAALAVLPRKHQSVRLYGLARKVLVIDELHAYDSYLLRLLKRLVTFHASMGGTTIVLSATLPRKTREEILSAHRQGLGSSGGDSTGPSSSFPLVTRGGPDGVSHTAVPRMEGNSRRVRVSVIDREEDAIKLACQFVERGGVTCWIRNTVADVIAAHRDLTQRIGADKVIVFHSRFAAGDRFDVEERVKSIAGKKSTAAERQGRIVIATQVVEQSLDLDFDEMITDLAPIDLIVQRAGRLHRHRRSKKGVLMDEGPDERSEPELHILAPAFTAQPNPEWYMKMFRRGAFVYKNHARLWLTLDVLRRTGAIQDPDGLRDLIDYVYGQDAETRIPVGLLKSHLADDGRTRADSGEAATAALALEQGYGGSTAKWEEDVDVGTRLGEPTSTFVLARRTPTGIKPWCAHAAHPWEMSEIDLPNRMLLSADTSESDTEAAWAAGLHPARIPGPERLLVFEPSGDIWRSTGTALRGQDRIKIRIHYSPATGFGTAENDNA